MCWVEKKIDRIIIFATSNTVLYSNMACWKITHRDEFLSSRIFPARHVSIFDCPGTGCQLLNSPVTWLASYRQNGASHGHLAWITGAIVHVVVDRIFGFWVAEIQGREDKVGISAVDPWNVCYNEFCTNCSRRSKKRGLDRKAMWEDVAL